MFPFDMISSSNQPPEKGVTASLPLKMSNRHRDKEMSVTDVLVTAMSKLCVGFVPHAPSSKSPRNIYTALASFPGQELLVYYLLTLSSEINFVPERQIGW